MGTGKTTFRVALLLFVLSGRSFDGAKQSRNRALCNLLQGMGADLTAFVAEYAGDGAQVPSLLGLPPIGCAFQTCKYDTGIKVMEAARDHPPG